MKREMHRTAQQCTIERLFLAAKGFNTNLAQFLLPYHVIFSNMHVCSFTCMDVYLKQFCAHEISCMKNYNLWRPCIYSFKKVQEVEFLMFLIDILNSAVSL